MIINKNNDKKDCSKKTLQMKKKEGTFFDDSSCKIYKENIDVYSEEGELLARFRKNVLTDKECKILFESKGAASRNSRPSAAGLLKGKSKYIKYKSKSTGKIIVSPRSKVRVRSGIMGYYDTSSYFSPSTDKSGNKNKKLRCRAMSYILNI